MFIVVVPNRKSWPTILIPTLTLHIALDGPLTSVVSLDGVWKSGPGLFHAEPSVFQPLFCVPAAELGQRESSRNRRSQQA